MRDETWFVELYERRYPAVLEGSARRRGASESPKAVIQVVIFVYEHRLVRPG